MKESKLTLLFKVIKGERKRRVRTLYFDAVLVVLMTKIELKQVFKVGYQVIN